MRKKIPVALLGASGLVGQHFITLLANHPWFELSELCASNARVGCCYGESVDWQMKDLLPPNVASMRFLPLEARIQAPLVFSALPASIAYQLEMQLATLGKAVISNASAHRHSENVPNVVAEVNVLHMSMIKQQKWSQIGFVVTNPNCVVSGLSIALKPLHDAFCLTEALILTMQAISGAGKHPTLKDDIMDNLIPFIAGEEEKIEKELSSLLGSLQGGRLIKPPIKISAHCHRVPVSDGHTAALSLAFKHKPSLDQIKELWRDYPSAIKGSSLPSAPAPLVVYQEEQNRPQPRLDRLNGKGMAVTIGRLRECGVHHVKFNLLVHNNIRGSAGSAILNAEYLLTEGYFS